MRFVSISCKAWLLYSAGNFEKSLGARNIGWRNRFLGVDSWAPSLKIRALCTVVRYIHKVVKMWMAPRISKNTYKDYIWQFSIRHKINTLIYCINIHCIKCLNFSGNILVKRLSKANIYVKNTLEENAVGLYIFLFYERGVVSETLKRNIYFLKCVFNSISIYIYLYNLVFSSLIFKYSKIMYNFCDSYTMIKKFTFLLFMENERVLRVISFS